MPGDPLASLSGDPEPGDRALVSEVLARLCVARGMSVVLVGETGGAFALPLARAVGPRGRLITIDPEAQELAGLREDVPRGVPAQSARAALGIATQDFVLCVNAWPAIERRDFALDEFARILKPDGYLVMVERRTAGAHPPTLIHGHRVSGRVVVDLLSRRGWSAISEVPVGEHGILIIGRPPGL